MDVYLIENIWHAFQVLLVAQMQISGHGENRECYYGNLSNSYNVNKEPTTRIKVKNIGESRRLQIRRNRLFAMIPSGNAK